MASHTVQLQALRRYHAQICAVIRALERLQRYQAGDTSDLTVLDPTHIAWGGKIGAKITFRRQDNV